MNKIFLVIKNLKGFYLHHCQIQVVFDPVSENFDLIQKRITNE